MSDHIWHAQHGDARDAEPIDDLWPIGSECEYRRGLMQFVAEWPLTVEANAALNVEDGSEDKRRVQHDVPSQRWYPVSVGAPEDSRSKPNRLAERGHTLCSICSILDWTG